MVGGDEIGIELAPFFSGMPSPTVETMEDLASAIDQDEVIEGLAEEFREKEELARVHSSQTATFNESWAGW
jgi:hypothetical protein